MRKDSKLLFDFEKQGWKEQSYKWQLIVCKNKIRLICFLDEKIYDFVIKKYKKKHGQLAKYWQKSSFALAWGLARWPRDSSPVWEKEKRIICADYDAALASSSAPVHTAAEENGSRPARKTEKGHARCTRRWKQQRQKKPFGEIQGKWQRLTCFLTFFRKQLASQNSLRGARKECVPSRPVSADMSGSKDATRTTFVTLCHSAARATIPNPRTSTGALPTGSPSKQILRSDSQDFLI